MPFMDNLTKIAKSVSDGAVNAAKKSGDLLEITKLNMSIQGEEDKIKVIKNEIGALIFEKRHSGTVTDPEILDLCKKIEDILDTIEALNQKIVELKNVKICQGCGNEIALHASFCPKCGAKNEMNTIINDAVQQKAVEETCSKCNTVVEKDALFCPSCGNNLRNE